MTGTGCLQYPWRSWVGGWSSDGSARRWPRVARVSRCVSSWCRGAPGGRRCLCMPVGEHVRHAGGRVDGDVLSHWGGRSLGGRDALGLHARPWGVGARWDAGTRTCDEVLALALGRHVFSKRVRPVFRAKGAAHTSRERREGRDVSASPPRGLAQADSDPRGPQRWHSGSLAHASLEAMLDTGRSPHPDVAPVQPRLTDTWPSVCCIDNDMGAVPPSG